MINLDSILYKFEFFTVKSLFLSFFKVRYIKNILEYFDQMIEKLKLIVKPLIYGVII